MTDLICVGRDDLDKTWPLVEHLFVAAYQATDFPMPDVLAWLKSGEGLLWLASDGTRVLSALTTALEQRASGMAMTLVANGGEDMAQWVHHLSEIEDYAKSKGCVKMRCIGRQGWSRVLSGYEVKTVSLEKRL